MQLKAFPIMLVIVLLFAGSTFGFIHIATMYGSIATPTGNTTNSKFLEITNHTYLFFAYWL